MRKFIIQLAIASLLISGIGFAIPLGLGAGSVFQPGDLPFPSSSGESASGQI